MKPRNGARRQRYISKPTTRCRASRRRDNYQATSYYATAAEPDGAKARDVIDIDVRDCVAPSDDGAVGEFQCQRESRMRIISSIAMRAADDGGC